MAFILFPTLHLGRAGLKAILAILSSPVVSHLPGHTHRPRGLSLIVSRTDTRVPDTQTLRHTLICHRPWIMMNEHREHLRYVWCQTQLSPMTTAEYLVVYWRTDIPTQNGLLSSSSHLHCELFLSCILGEYISHILYTAVFSELDRKVLTATILQTQNERDPSTTIWQLGTLSDKCI